MRRLAAAAILAFLGGPAFAHVMPNSTVHLAPAGEALTADLRVPLSELQIAYGRPLAPAAIPSERAALEAYLRAHVAVSGTDGRYWPLAVESLAAARDHDHDQLAVRLRFDPPPGRPSCCIRLTYDAVNHEVMSHFALVHWTPQPGAAATPVARMQAPLREVVVIVRPDLPQSADPAPRIHAPARPWLWPALGFVILAVFAGSWFSFRRLR